MQYKGKVEHQRDVQPYTKTHTDDGLRQSLTPQVDAVWNHLCGFCGVHSQASTGRDDAMKGFGLLTREELEDLIMSLTYLQNPWDPKVTNRKRVIKYWVGLTMKALTGCFSIGEVRIPVRPGKDKQSFQIRAEADTGFLYDCLYRAARLHMKFVLDSRPPLQGFHQMGSLRDVIRLGTLFRKQIIDGKWPLFPGPEVLGGYAATCGITLHLPQNSSRHTSNQGSLGGTAATDQPGGKSSHVAGHEARGRGRRGGRGGGWQTESSAVAGSGVGSGLAQQDDLPPPTHGMRRGTEAQLTNETGETTPPVNMSLPRDSNTAGTSARSPLGTQRAVGPIRVAGGSLQDGDHDEDLRDDEDDASHGHGDEGVQRRTRAADGDRDREEAALQRGAEAPGRGSRDRRMRESLAPETSGSGVERRGKRHRQGENPLEEALKEGKDDIVAVLECLKNKEPEGFDWGKEILRILRTHAKEYRRK